MFGKKNVEIFVFHRKVVSLYTVLKQIIMQTYQINTLVSENGVIKLPEMPYLYNKKVKLIIISSEDNSTELEQRKQAMERLLKRQDSMPVSHWTDQELDNIKYECLKEKYQCDFFHYLEES